LYVLGGIDLSLRLLLAIVDVNRLHVLDCMSIEVNSFQFFHATDL
jgi:hypothetical protein